MYVRTICYPVTVLGPGRRLGIWLSGCSKRCPGCMSPELRERRATDDVPLETVFRVVDARADDIDGVTISGGEPFEQARELCELVEHICENVTEDILVYTGWTLDDVRADTWGKRALSFIATLVDGPYVEEMDDGIGLRGSSNQVVHRLKRLPAFDFEHEKRRVQSFVFDNHAFMVGLG